MSNVNSKMARDATSANEEQEETKPDSNKDSRSLDSSPCAEPCFDKFMASSNTNWLTAEMIEIIKSPGDVILTRSENGTWSAQNVPDKASGGTQVETGTTPASGHPDGAQGLNKPVVELRQISQLSQAGSGRRH